MPVGGSGEQHPLLLQWYQAPSRCPCRAGVPQPPALQLTSSTSARQLHGTPTLPISTVFALPGTGSPQTPLCSASPFLSQVQSHPMCSSLGERCTVRPSQPLAHLPSHTPPRLCGQTPLLCPGIREQPDSSCGVQALQLKQGQHENSAAAFSSSQR